MIIITGQTATGKTALALEYAKKYKGELVNFDSRQIYKYLDIITGKDLPAKTGVSSEGLPTGRRRFFQPAAGRRAQSGLRSKQDPFSVWLYDIVTPDQYFSSFEYVKIAQKVIKDIKLRGKTPILVGGTYFYLKHLLYGFDYQVPPDFILREKLNQKSVAELQKIIQELDPEIKQKMNQSDWQNPRRLIRKIEILKNQGQNLSGSVLLKTVPDLFIGLKHKNKEHLYQAIKTRVEKRLKQGAIKEVEKILKMGYKKTDPGLNTIGYKQIIDYLEGNITKDQAIEKWITAEVQYAKRQYTFMKKDKNIKWIEI
ncbi:MAG: tRNA dimethylallyltransferase [Patescibacteria group bacterium]|nr:MAG: tRNA dimethylallyltransferase [Patescibacteria group bacterium]